MPRTEKENAKIREKRKNEILDAAIEVFAKKGYEKTSCDDINKKVGCSHGLFYRYFKSKDDIYNALIAKYKELYFGKTAEILSSGEDPQITFKKLISFFVDLINRSKKDAYIAFIILTSPIVKQSEINEFDERLLNLLVDLLMKSNIEGEPIDKKNAQSLALCFYHMLLGMCYTKINYSNSLTDQYIEIENVFLNILKGS